MAAPLGYKDFATGDVLTANDVDGYLMQGIWVFASAAARDAAVTSPQEGNACYLKDTDVIQVYTGSTWATQSASNPISANIVDAKGDIIAATAADTVSRLAVGANDTVLTADSSTATGLKWAAAAASGFTYATYTPTFTNFTLGNGTINSARWAQSGKMVHVYGQVTLGSTSSVSGNITLSLPATAASSNSGIWTGWAAYGDDGVGSYTGLARIQSTTTLRLDVNKADGTYNLVAGTSSTVPMTWTNLDDFRFSLVYEAA